MFVNVPAYGVSGPQRVNVEVSVHIHTVLSWYSNFDENTDAKLQNQHDQPANTVTKLYTRQVLPITSKYCGSLVILECTANTLIGPVL